MLDAFFYGLAFLEKSALRVDPAWLMTASFVLPRETERIWSGCVAAAEYKKTEIMKLFLCRYFLHRWNEVESFEVTVQNERTDMRPSRKATSNKRLFLQKRRFLSDVDKKKFASQHESSRSNIQQFTVLFTSQRLNLEANWRTSIMQLRPSNYSKIVDVLDL